MAIADNMLHRYSDVACCRLWSRLGEWHHRDGVASAIATRWGQFVTLVFMSCPETAHAKHSKRCKRWKRVQTMMSYQKPHDDVNAAAAAAAAPAAAVAGEGLARAVDPCWPLVIGFRPCICWFISMRGHTCDSHDDADMSHQLN